MTEDFVRSLFVVAGIPVTNVYETPNRYWPDTESYADVRKKNPWWVVFTPVGPILIGRRKRVTEVDWSGTSIRKVVTEDDVTKSETYVHAWTTPKLVEYLCALQQESK